MAQPAVWLEYLKTSNASRVYVIVCAYSDLSDWISALCNYFIVLVDVIELMMIFIYAETAHRLARTRIFIYFVMLHVRHFFARLISAFHKASGQWPSVMEKVYRLAYDRNNLELVCLIICYRPDVFKSFVHDRVVGGERRWPLRRVFI